MEVKKLALYYGVNQEVIGVRECLHDWEEGDVITTNGVKTEIYAIFDSTMRNMKILAGMFCTLNVATQMGCLKNYTQTHSNEELDNEWMFEYNDFFDLLAVMTCTPWTMKKRQWADYEKRLDFMEEMVELIENSEN